MPENEHVELTKFQRDIYERILVGLHEDPPRPAGERSAEQTLRAMRSSKTMSKHHVAAARWFALAEQAGHATQ